MDKTCFVISPLGDEGSETREEADALLWIVRSALEKYDFKVVRVDEIARSTQITNEIVQLIQESALAIIILTGMNPNVYYEAGRRHETGKPFIQLIKKGEKLPFDVAGVKTIIYDGIDSRQGAARTIAEMQKYIEEFEKAGYGITGSGVSLSTVAAALDRIERKISQPMAGGSNVSSGRGLTPTENLGEIYRNPKEAFMLAIAQGNIERAAAILPRLQQICGNSAELVAAAGYLAEGGYEPAVDIIFGLLTDHYEKIASESTGMKGIRTGISSLVDYYNLTDREKEGLLRLNPLFDRILSDKKLDAEEKAFFLNQLQKMLYGAKEYEKAMGIAEQVMKYSPDDAAYVYNASLIYEKLNLQQKALEMVDRFMKMEDPEATHLRQAVEIYVASGRIPDARNAFAQLRSQDPAKASLLLMDSDIRKALS